MQTRLINAGFIVAFCLLALIGLLSWQQSQRLADANGWVAHTNRVINVLDSLLSDLNDAENGQRGFLVTGDVPFLEPYHQALGRVGKDISAIRELTRDNTGQQRNLKTLQPVIQARLDRFAQGIEVRRQQGFEATDAYTSVGAGKKLMDVIQRNVAGMTAVENGLLTQHNEAALQALHASNQVILAGYVLSLITIGWAFLTFQRQNAARLRAEAEKRQTENRLSLLVNSVRDYGIIMLDPNGKVMNWNDGARRIKGYEPDEIIGRHFSLFYPASEQVAGKPELELAIATKAGIYQEEGWRVRKGGSRFWASVVLTAMRDDQGQLEGFAKITRDMTERKQAEDAQKRLNEILEMRVEERTAELKHEVEMRRAGEEALRELTVHLESVREAERSRIAREIHDDLGSALTALKLDTQAYIERAGSTVSEAAVDRRRLIDEAIQSLRRIINDLRPGILDHLGLWAALEWQTTEFRERMGIAATFELLGDECEVEAGRATALFRLYQEALTNIAKYARATRVHASAVVEDGTIIFEIRDNGIGIDEERLLNTKSFGIRGMHERMLAFNGSVHISGAPQQGTTVTAMMPVPAVT